MEFVVEQEDLSKAVNLTQNCVGKKSTMPILVNLLISTQSGAVKITGSDVHITTVVSIPAEVRVPGSTTVSVKVFSEIVRELPVGKVTIVKSEGEQIEIKAGETYFKFAGISADSYPALPITQNEIQSVTSSQLLSDMIQKTIFATSIDDTRANMNGVCFEVVPTSSKSSPKKSILKMAATDGFRLSVVSRPIAEFSLKEPIIVPRRALLEIKKALDYVEDSPVKMEITGEGDSFLEVEIENVRIAARLSDSAFPNYSSVIPNTQGTLISIDREQLLQALRRTTLMIPDKSKGLEMFFSEGKVVLRSFSRELGEATEEITINYNGEPFKVGLNALYLMEILASTPQCSQVVLDLHGEGGPIKVTFEDDESFLGIVMPMRIVV